MKLDVVEAGLVRPKQKSKEKFMIGLALDNICSCRQSLQEAGSSIKRAFCITGTMMAGLC